MKKRYWLFVIARYYPSGGMGDFVKDFDSLDELKESDEYFKGKQDAANSFIEATLKVYDVFTDKYIDMGEEARHV